MVTLCPELRELSPERVLVVPAAGQNHDIAVPVGTTERPDDLPRVTLVDNEVDLPSLAVRQVSEEFRQTVRLTLAVLKADGER